METLRQMQRRVRKDLIEEGAEARCGRGALKDKQGAVHIYPSRELQRAHIKKCMSSKVKTRVKCEMDADALLSSLVRTLDMPARLAESQARVAFNRMPSQFTQHRLLRAQQNRVAVGESVQKRYIDAMSACRRKSLEINK